MPAYTNGALKFATPVFVKHRSLRWKDRHGPRLYSVRLGTTLHSGKALPGAGTEFREIGEVAAIGLDGVLAGALFRREHVEEQAGQFRI